MIPHAAILAALLAAAAPAFGGESAGACAEACNVAGGAHAQAQAGCETQGRERPLRDWLNRPRPQPDETRPRPDGPLRRLVRGAIDMASGWWRLAAAAPHVMLAWQWILMALVVAVIVRLLVGLFRRGG